MNVKITGFEAIDVRFPTSQHLDGSDAMNPDPDYSAAYVILKTDGQDLFGYGMTFTIGRGNELCVAAIKALAPLLMGQTLTSLMVEPWTMYRRLTGDSQLRWVGPEKGVIHLAAAALVNAVWDLWARWHSKPLWRLVADMSPEQFVASVDFRYLTDVLTKAQALELLNRHVTSKSQRIEQMLNIGYPSYTTSAGWLGYSDEALKQKCEDLKQRGWSHFKIDANQVWDVPEAIAKIKELAHFNPWFVEEPTNPDDILGHQKIARAIAPIRVASGEMCHNRVMFKQFLESGAMQVCQLDSCRLGGVNEVLAVMLLAARFGVPVCPHAGGVGLCEHVQHLCMIDYICVSATTEGRVAEYSDHLHEHMQDPLLMRDGHYLASHSPGYGVKFTEAALSNFTFVRSEA
jgi:L-fuconate dehydratase